MFCLNIFLAMYTQASQSLLADECQQRRLGSEDTNLMWYDAWWWFALAYMPATVAGAFAAANLSNRNHIVIVAWVKVGW